VGEIAAEASASIHRPYLVSSSRSAGVKSPERDASKYAVLDDNPGKGEGRPGAEEQRVDHIPREKDHRAKQEIGGDRDPGVQAPVAVLAPCLGHQVGVADQTRLWHDLRENITTP